MGLGQGMGHQRHYESYRNRVASLQGYELTEQHESPGRLRVTSWVRLSIGGMSPHRWVPKFGGYETQDKLTSYGSPDRLWVTLGMMVSASHQKVYQPLQQHRENGSPEWVQVNRCIGP